MGKGINRRDFLRLASMAPLGLALPPLLEGRMGAALQANRKNVLIVIFDAFTARNMSAYGYGRETTPNLARLAKRAVVYHDHYAAGNFTTPGTASILTGVLPWTHRGIQLAGRMNPRFNKRSIFSIFSDYHRFAYTHNPLVFALLRPLAAQMEELLPMEALFLQGRADPITTILGNDEDIARVSWSRATNLADYGYAYSLFLSQLVTAAESASRQQGIARLFPRGLPGHRDLHQNFVLETAIGWLGQISAELPQPFLGYVHLLPPHEPYHTRIEFMDRFKDDGYEAAAKPRDLFANADREGEGERRREYDEFLLYVDEEFGLLYDALEASGILDNTWLVLTSDHGESFERGLRAHGTRALYEPQVRVPLMIFEPGREAGQEIHDPTSSIDLLPTLAMLTGHPVPDWTEGYVLPPYGAAASERRIYAVMASENDPASPIHTGTFMIVKDNYKLQYYVGYEELAGRELVQLFDLAADPEEMQDLARSRPDVSGELLAELKAKMEAADQPYQK